MNNGDTNRQNCQGVTNNLSDWVGENKKRTHQLYQRVGARTAFTYRLVCSQFPPAEAFQIGFKVYGNPSTNQDNGGAENA